MEKTRAKLLQISQLGNPILWQKATEITNFKSKELQELIDDMIVTLKGKGVGIAAPQVYESKRIFIVASEPSKRRPDVPKMKPTAMINPRIIHHSEEIEKDVEGCLSIPGFVALVPRYTRIEVEFFTREGKKKTKIFKDFVARIFQHELDHLNGIVYIDRLETMKDLATEGELEEILKKKSKKKSVKK